MVVVSGGSDRGSMTIWILVLAPLALLASGPVGVLDIFEVWHG